MTTTNEAARVDACVYVEKETAEALKRAEAEHAELASKHNLAKEDLAIAEGVYANDPTEENGKTVTQRADKLRLADVLLRPAEKKLGAAKTAHEGAVRALEQARRELARVEIENAKAAAIAELRRLAGLEEFHKRVAPRWRALLDALALVRAEARAIDREFRDANKAAAKLREQGVELRDLDPLHAVSDCLAILGQDDPQRIAGVVANVETIRLAGTRGLEPTLLDWIDRLVAAATSTTTTRPELLARAQLELEMRTKSRTDHEAKAALADELFRRGDREEVNRRRVHKLPAPEGFAVPDRAPWAPIESWLWPSQVEQRRAEEERAADRRARRHESIEKNLLGPGCTIPAHDREDVVRKYG
jgi:hypothetical protein